MVPGRRRRRGGSGAPFDGGSGLPLTRVYRYRLRSILSRRWTDYLLLTALVAIVGGVAMGSVVAGRRTQSAYASFLARDDASTLTMSTYGLAGGAAANAYSPRVEQRIRSLPEVSQVESWIATYIVPIAPDGTPDLALTRQINVAGSIDGVFFHEDRATVIKGRLADPADPHEFMTSEQGAHLLGVRLGQTIEFGAFTQALVTMNGFGTAAVQPVARFPLRLVGIIDFNNQVVQDDADRIPINLVVTPALARTQEAAANGTWFAIRLKPGVRNLASVEQKLLNVLTSGALGQFYLTSTTEAKVESALRPESIALGAFGLIAALAAFGLCLPIIARMLVSSQGEREVLRDLGASRSVVAADFYVGVALSVLLGAVLAGLLSSVVGSIAPLGPVHAVYHPGGLVLDWTVVAVGMVLLVGVLAGAAVVLVRSRSPHSHLQSASRTPGASLAGAVAAAGLPASSVVGAHFALPSGPVRASGATRSVLAGGVLSVTLVVATLTFASGLRTLVGHPALYGWNWGYTLLANSNVPPDALMALQHDPMVQSWSGYIGIDVTIDGQSVPLLMATNSLDVTPPLLAGRQIAAAGEIILGRATLAALHRRIGDTVRVGFGSPSTAPLYLPPVPLHIVGAATFPAVSGSSNFADHTTMGVGALFSSESLPALFRGATSNPDPVQNGPVMVLVRYKPGTSRAADRADVQRILAIAARQIASDPMAAGNSVSDLPVERPAAIVNYQSTGYTPLVLALGLAAAATAALALSMTATVRRRRRDLAVLKTLGFVRRQVIATVATQALVTALIAIGIGLPLGIAAGRQLWVVFARNIYAVPKPTVPGSVALVAVGAVLIAVAAAAIPGRLAARTPAASVLRAD